MNQCSNYRNFFERDYYRKNFEKFGMLASEMAERSSSASGRHFLSAADVLRLLDDGDDPLESSSESGSSEDSVCDLSDPDDGLEPGDVHEDAGFGGTDSPQR